MADSDRRVVHAPLCSAAERRENKFDKRCWDRLNTVLKLKLVKDSEVAEVLVDTLVFFIIRPCRIGIASIPGAPGDVPICYGYIMYMYRMCYLHTAHV